MPLINLALLAGYVLAAVGAAACFYLFRKHLQLRSRRDVVVFAVIWSAILLLEFYVFGPASFISMNIDGNLGVPFFIYLDKHHLGGQFAHAVAGGQDIDAVTGFGTQAFSLERILFGFLPTWFAIFVLKLVVVLIGFISSYKLCRTVGPSTRTVAAALGAAFTVAISYNINATTWNGIGYSVLPLTLYLTFAREGKPHYLWGLALLGILAATTEPLHTFLAVAGTIAGGAILFGGFRLRAAALSLTIVVIVMLASWHEPFFAMKQIAPLTIRGRLNFGDVSLSEVITTALSSFLALSAFSTGLMVTAAAVLAWRRHAYFWSAVGSMAIVIACYVLLRVVPWEAFGLGIIKGLSPHYIYYAVGALMLPVGARAMAVPTGQEASATADSPGGSETRWRAAAILASAAAVLITYKIDNWTNFLYYGGQSQYYSIENLAHPDWAPREPFRVVTLRHQSPEPEIPLAFYGFDTFDGALSLALGTNSIFWRDGILKNEGDEGFFGRLSFDWRFFKDGHYDIAQQANLDLLRTANVGFIISPVPVGSGLVFVSGPASPPATRADGLRSLLLDRLPRIFDRGKVYIYALPEPLPRAFAATSLHRMAEGTDEAEFLSEISRRAPSRQVVIRGPSGDLLDRALNPGLVVDSIDRTKDGYDLRVRAQQGGVLVLNATPFPFWTAKADSGTPLPIIQVNAIHMAVAVPPGTRTVDFRYDRPSVRSLLFERLGHIATY